MRFARALLLLLLPQRENSATPIAPEPCRYERPRAPAAIPNDNRTPAGSATGNVLRLNLAIRTAGWYPEGPSGCGLTTPAFAEEGKAPQIPAPLIRVRAGTELQVSVRNELTTSLRILGLHDRGRVVADTAMIAAGAATTLRFVATVPGTYFYRAVAHPAPAPGSPNPNTQLVGAFVVDSSGMVPDDRIVVVTRWVKFVPNPRAAASELPVLPGNHQLAALNGLSWPHTERFRATAGDTVRWRVINGDMADTHPMHLHGFYYRVTAYGDMQRDTVYSSAQQRMAVTEWMPPGRTMSIEWSPDREGNWLFHCHMVIHMSPNQKLDRILGSADSSNGGAPAVTGHPQHTGHSHEMAGLLMGISVAARRNTNGAPPSPPRAAPRRRLRLLAHTKANVFDDLPGYGFLLQEGSRAPAADSIRIPGSELALTLGEPVEIVVQNRTTIPISVHWHGIELESYYDGVAGWSGDTRRLAPAIAAGDSFVVHITPPRAGTFIYHIHDEGGVELASGMYGPLIVRARGADTSNEHTFVIGSGGPGPARAALSLVNGSISPDTLDLVAGRAYRFRLIGITPNGPRRVSFVGPEGPHPWRQIARDGWELGSREPLSPTPFRIGPGITADYEIKAEAGDYHLEVGTPPSPGGRPGVFTKVPVRVR